ncbi:hypothetical protein D3C87_1467030 [compost metagenome]
MQDGINRFFIQVFDLRFRGVHIHVYIGRINVYKQHVQRKMIIGQQLFISLVHRVVQVSIFYETVVYKKELLAPGFLCIFRLPDIAF